MSRNVAPLTLAVAGAAGVAWGAAVVMRGGWWLTKANHPIVGWCLLVTGGLGVLGSVATIGSALVLGSAAGADGAAAS